jgi:hypothetical protein
MLDVRENIWIINYSKGSHVSERILSQHTNPFALIDFDCFNFNSFRKYGRDISKIQLFIHNTVSEHNYSMNV